MSSPPTTVKASREDAAIVSVVVDSALPHLDRRFDYLVPEALQGMATVGTRVRVPFAGRLVSAVVVDSPREPPAGVALAHVKSAAGLESFTPSGIQLARAVAERYGGSLWDVLRLMAPPRVASVEKRGREAFIGEGSTERLQRALEHVADASTGAPTRAVWNPTPTSDRSTVPARALLAHALEHLLRGPRIGTAIVVVPDARALSACARVAQEAGLERWRLGRDGDYVILDHDAGPTERYSSYLAAMHGGARVVFGTRTAALQPVPQLSSITVWDEGSDALLDPHAPYFHARTIAAMRAQEPDVALLLASFAPSVEAVALVEHGFAEAIVPDRATARAAAPLVNIVGEELREVEGGSGRHWMPSAAWRGLTEVALEGPVAVLVPRAGYVKALACARCHTWAKCPSCEGEMSLVGPGGPPRCRDCGTEHSDLHCSECSSPHFAAARQGVEAIAAQIRKMAPRADVVISSAGTGVLEDGHIERGFVVATPGALPAVADGYLRLVIIGADRPTPGGVSAELVAARWWINAAALVRAGSSGGVVTLVGNVLPSVRRAVQSWDPWGAALAAYSERRDLGLPPVRRALRLDGSPPAIEAAMRIVGQSRDTDVAVDVHGATVLVSRAQAQPLVTALRAIVVERSKQGESPLRMRVDAALP